MSIRVLIVDDSRFFQRRVKEILSADAEIDVVGFADDGIDAIQKVKELAPDVVTMDVEMPIMDGITAVKKIMADNPLPIIMFSSVTRKGAKATLDALEAGAVDFIPKNFDDVAKDRDVVKKLLCEKIISVAKSNYQNISTRHRTVTSPSSDVPNKVSNSVSDPNKYKAVKLVAIGTSTGGPIALQQILARLPKTFPLPIILVQHMPGSFTPAFAKRLDGLCQIQVKEAESGDLLTAATAYLAPGGCQMLIAPGGKITIKDCDKSEAYNPCVDRTFMSANEVYQGEILAIILTGMGADGCKGSEKLKSAGCEIWAQDEKSCVVFGMPGAVVEAGIVDCILSINDIADRLPRKFQ